jgi:hypothetical protein
MENGMERSPTYKSGSAWATANILNKKQRAINSESLQRWRFYWNIAV